MSPQVKQGQLTPGIPTSEYERRRRQLVEGLPRGSLVVSVAGQIKYMSAGEPFYTHTIPRLPENPIKRHLVSSTVFSLTTLLPTREATSFVNLRISGI
jgi:hypothetical protein